MGRLQLFEIRLSRGRVVYGPGEPLAGAVCVRLGAPLPFRAIRVSCSGCCRVSSKAGDTAWAAEESYANSSLALADKGSLPAGEHNFPFQFLLPAAAPTSFEGPFGRIVYQLRAAIDTPRFHKDHECSLDFYVLSPLNLNGIPDIEQPNVASTTRRFSYKLLRTGRVVLTASTDLRGYVAGQALRLQVDLDNQSGKDTGPVVASLLQKVSYKARRWVYDVRTIAAVEGVGARAWRRAQWQEQVLVPALPQSALPGCSLIHVDYFLQVSLKAPEASVTLPVFIGDIAVNRAPLSPPPGLGLPSWVVPSAPPQEVVGAAGAPCADPVPLCTWSHAQQLLPPPPAGPGAPEPRPQLHSSPAPPVPPPPVSAGAAVPCCAAGSGGPAPPAAACLLPPEYSASGHPCAEWGACLAGRGPRAPCGPGLLPAEAPPSYEQSCGGAAPSPAPGR